jgi:hypothetical protein
VIRDKVFSKYNFFKENARLCLGKVSLFIILRERERESTKKKSIQTVFHCQGVKCFFFNRKWEVADYFKSNLSISRIILKFKIFIDNQKLWLKNFSLNILT